MCALMHGNGLRRETVFVSLNTDFSKLRGGMQNGWCFNSCTMCFGQGDKIYGPVIDRPTLGLNHTCEQLVRSHFRNTIHRQTTVKLISKKTLCSCFTGNMYTIRDVYRLLYFDERSGSGILGCRCCKVIAIARNKHGHFAWELIWFNSPSVQLPAELHSILA